MDHQTIRRWRLLLGKEAENDRHTLSNNEPLNTFGLSTEELIRDDLLEHLYEPVHSANLSQSAPYLAHWISQIQEYFALSSVHIMQNDAIERLGLKLMLLEPEAATHIVPDLNLLSSLLLLRQQLEPRHLPAARRIIKNVAEAIMSHLRQPLLRAVSGSLNRANRKTNPRHHEIDWQRTILANLKHYSADQATIIPEQLIGYSRKRMHLRDIILCIDQSGSMATSVVHGSLSAAILASLPSLDTRLVAFDTSVVDLTALLKDPVELLLGFQLGGGTDIRQALQYCMEHISRPADTILILISDLLEGGRQETLHEQARLIHDSGVQFITLLALSDGGQPAFDQNNAATFSQLGIPTFACTPDLMPDLIAAAIEKRDIFQWAGQHDLQTHRHSV